ncbi:BA14K family protein [Mesorhizobium sp. 10J20-29]
MKKILSGLMATAISATFAFSGIAPSAAAPVYIPTAKVAQTTDVVDVRHRKWHRNGFRRDRGNVYYNGHRGYRERRRGYRQYNGFWFPLGAFAAGAIIGGALNSNNNVYRGGNAHVQWCYDRYRSYRASDNTFQPYHGPRQQCYSPYD